MVRVIPNAIDLAQFTRPPLSAPPVPPAPIHIGYIGRIHPEKGLELLVKSLCILATVPGLPPWRVSLTGPVTPPEGGGGDAFLQRLRKAIFPVLGDKVEIRPPVWDRAALASHYRDLDIFCYPSLADRGETFGVSVVEAMAAGAVPVLSDLPCFSDFATEDANALHFERHAPDAPARLAEILARLIRDPRLRDRLSKNARETARRYDLDNVAGELEADLFTLANG